MALSEGLASINGNNESPLLVGFKTTRSETKAGFGAVRTKISPIGKSTTSLGLLAPTIWHISNGIVTGPPDSYPMSFGTNLFFASTSSWAAFSWFWSAANEYQ